MRGALVRPAAVGRLRLTLASERGRLRLTLASERGRLRLTLADERGRMGRLPWSAGRQPWPAGRVPWLAVRMVALVALIPVALYAWAAVHRIAYPYELDWLEGGGVELVSRVMDGRSLYAAPTLAYAPYTYPPLYSWVSAAVAEVTGIGFLPLRIVSAGSSVVAFAAMWKLVVAATGDRAAAVVGVGLFAATYGLTGWWFDVGRLDSMFLALTLVALWIGRGAESARGGVVFGLVAFLAFFTKQVALVAVAPALALVVVTRWRVGVAALLTLAVLFVGSTVALDAATGGWYRYYVFSELSGQPLEPREWRGFWRIDLYSHLRPVAWLAVVALGAGVVAAGRRWVKSGMRVRPVASIRGVPAASLRAPAYAYEIAVVAGLLAAAWISRLHLGGYVNVLMPAYAAAALLGALAFASLRTHGALATLGAVALVGIQLTGLVGSVSGAIPAPGQSAAGAAVIARLRSLPGPVLVLSHPWYGTLAGKGSFAQQDALEEVIRSDSPRGAAYLDRDLIGALNRYGISAVVLDGPAPGWLAPQLGRDFVLQPAPLTPTALRDPADVRTAPRFVYLRRSSG